MQNLGGLFCSICLDYFAKPVITKCGHSFCEFCIEEYFLYFQICPTCEEPVRSERTYPIMALTEFVEEFVRKNDPQSEADLKKRIQKNQSFKAQKHLNAFPVGTKVDIRDSSYIWKEGIIIRIISRVGEAHKFIKVQYEGPFEKVQEDIRVNSERLAKFGFYTQRPDIPKSRSPNPEMHSSK